MWVLNWFHEVLNLSRYHGVIIAKHFPVVFQKSVLRRMSVHPYCSIELGSPQLRHLHSLVSDQIVCIQVFPYFRACLLCSSLCIRVETFGLVYMERIHNCRSVICFSFFCSHCCFERVPKVLMYGLFRNRLYM